MQTLFQGIAKHHSVDVAIVRQYSAERDPLVDTPVILSFGLLYLFVAYIFTGRMLRRFPANDSTF